MITSAMLQLKPPCRLKGSRRCSPVPRLMQSSVRNTRHFPMLRGAAPIHTVCISACGHLGIVLGGNGNISVHRVGAGIACKAAAPQARRGR